MFLVGESSQNPVQIGDIMFNLSSSSSGLLFLALRRQLQADLSYLARVTDGPQTPQSSGNHLRSWKDPIRSSTV